MIRLSHGYSHGSGSHKEAGFCYGATSRQANYSVADALAKQTPGLTEAEVGAAIAKAMAQTPGVSQEDIQAAVSQAMESQMPVMPERMSTTITVVLDNVGAPQFRNEKGTWPDVMFHGFFGFQEPLLGWTPAEDDMGNPMVNRNTCAAPLVITGWDGHGEENGSSRQGMGWTRSS